MRNSTAIICELNPIHPGHRHLLKLASATFSPIIAVVGGNFTQRGEAALWDAYVRARSAVLCGADLALLLPYPWCAAGAEDFARGGAAVAAGVGADSLTFGSESGDLIGLEKAAALRASEAFGERYRAAESSGRTRGSAAVYEEVMRTLGGPDTLGPNDKLGLEYIRFGRAAGIGAFHPIRRLDGLPSASEIRDVLRTAPDGWEAASDLVAAEARELFEAAPRCDPARYEALLYTHALLFVGGDETSSILRYAAKAARQTIDPGEFMRALPTKKYTAARMRRELLRSVIYGGTFESEAMAKTDPRWTVLLAANARGRAYLAGNRDRFRIPVVVKPADLSALDEEAKRQNALNRRADEVYAYLAGLPVDTYVKMKPAMED